MANQPRRLSVIFACLALLLGLIGLSGFVVISAFMSVPVVYLVLNRISNTESQLDKTISACK